MPGRSPSPTPVAAASRCPGDRLRRRRFPVPVRRQLRAAARATRQELERPQLRYSTDSFLKAGGNRHQGHFDARCGIGNVSRLIDLRRRRCRNRDRIAADEHRGARGLALRRFVATTAGLTDAAARTRRPDKRQRAHPLSSTVNDFGIRPTTVTAMRRSEACTASERMTPRVPESGRPGPGVRRRLEELIVRIQLAPGVVSVAHGD